MLNSIKQGLLFTMRTRPYVLAVRNPFTRSLSLALAATIPPSPTASYLMDSCGLSLESALSASQKIQLKGTERADSVLELFREYGLSNTHITNIISKQPDLLLYDTQKNLKPKMEFLHGLGFSGAALIKLLTSEPLLLKRSLEHHLIPFFDFLRSVLHTDEAVVAVFSTSSRALQSNLRNTVLPSIQVLRKHDLSEPRISKLIKVHPGVLLQGPNRVNALVEEVKATGISTSDPMFIYAFGTISGMKRSTWEQKMALYGSFGWTEDEVLLAFRNLPICMKISEKKIREGMEFYNDKLKLPRACIIAQPKLLLPSIEKTIMPRCAVLSVLMSKGKIRKDLSLISALMLPEGRFVNRYVKKYEDDVPEVLKAYRGEIIFEGLDIGC